MNLRLELDQASAAPGPAAHRRDCSLTGGRRSSSCVPVALGQGIDAVAYECANATCVSIDANRLTGHALSDTLAVKMLEAVGRMPHRLIVIDLAGVGSMSTAVAEQFVACSRTLRSQGRSLKLAGLNDQLRQALKLVDITRFAGVCADVNEALIEANRPRRWWHLGGAA